jgi:type IV secretion system protein VirB2
MTCVAVAIIPYRPASFAEKSAEPGRGCAEYRPNFPRNFATTDRLDDVSMTSPEYRRDANVRNIESSMARRLAIGAALSLPGLAYAQQSPFDTGANSLVTFALTIATPVAILVVIGAAIAAAVGRISWGWVVGLLVGIAAIFGSPQIVAWIRGMFGV